MRLHLPRPFLHLHEPLRMDELAWLALFLGALLAMLFRPELRG